MKSCSHPRDALVVEAEPIASVKIFNINVIMAAGRTTGMHHYGEQFVHIRSRVHAVIAILFIFVLITNVDAFVNIL